MTPLYTRKGDDGYTGRLGKGRVPKYDLQIHALGAVDEATAALGLARSLCQVEANKALLLAVQRDLYMVMAELASTPDTAPKFRQISEEKIAWLEARANELYEAVSIPNEFIIPGDTQSGAALALARTIVRRAERQVSEMLHTGAIENHQLLSYLNRLSSLCFILELAENAAALGNATPTLAKENQPD